MNKDLINIFFKDRYHKPFSKPIIIAHRGASGYEPENTLRSFKRALEMGSFMIELDVFLCKSEKHQESHVIVIHDETIDRTTNGQGSIHTMSCEILRKFDAGKGEHIPLLSEVFDLIDKIKGNRDIVINIELKGLDTAKAVADLIEYYIQSKNWSPHNFIISSFNHNSLKEFHRYLPEIKMGALFYKSTNDLVKEAQHLKATYIILDYTSITQSLITKAHSHGLFVFVYTVNNSSIAQELAKWHVDGIITDYPDILSDAQFDTNVLH